MSNWTLAQASAHNAKVSGGKMADGGSANACDDESQLHLDIKEYCKGKLWLVESGSMAHRTKRRVGELDLTIAMNDGKTAWVECKKKGEKPTPEQSATIYWLNHLGHKAFVCYSLEDFINQINQK